MAGFFSKVIDNVNKGVNIAGANSKAMIEKTKINMSISNFEKDKMQLLLELGNRFYEVFKEQDLTVTDEAILALIDGIDKKNEYIADHREQLKKVERELGQVSDAYKNTTPDDVAICFSCGTMNQLDAKECSVCLNQL